jgi:alginate O-acetyltransferase complex protein AlgI
LTVYDKYYGAYLKKIVIADNCATIANEIFNNSADYSGSTLFLGALFFAFQIYGDFSGYSDIAIGTARLFGFRLMQNFAFPYFSRDMAEFWRRWHISLSTWFRDYLYIPLGGSRGGTRFKIRNTFIIFLVSRFWYGASWTFIVWGGLNAVYFLPLLLSKSNRRNLDVVANNSSLPSFRELIAMLSTFILAVLAWVFFRAENLNHAFSYLGTILSPSILSVPKFEGMSVALYTFVLLGLFISIEWRGRRDQYAIEKFTSLWNKPLRHSFYYFLILIIFLFGGQQQEFIYFQF